MGTVKLFFFAHLKEQIGKKEMTVTLAEPLSVKQLLMELDPTFPREALQAPGVQIAINHEIASPEAMIHEGDEIAFLPPFSGG